MAGETSNEAFDENALTSGGATYKIFIALLIVVGVLWWRAARPASSLASEGWVSDWDRAVEQSRASGKPALVLFTADWCPSCRALESQVLARPDAKACLAEHHTVV